MNSDRVNFKREEATAAGYGTVAGQVQGESENESELSTRSLLKKKGGFTESELWDKTVTNRDMFPDPTEPLAILRFFSGIGYAFGGLKRTFTEGYLVLSLYQSCIVGLVIALWALLSLGVSVTLIEAAIAIFGGRTEPWDRALILFYVLFALTFAFFWFIAFGIAMAPLIQAVISSESQKLSYIVELRMNGLPWSTRDVLCGQASDGPSCFSFDWFVELIKGIIDNLIRGFFMFLLRNIQALLLLICMQLLSLLMLLIPGIGPFITTATAVMLFFISIAYFFFDLIMVRKEMSFFMSMRTVWNNVWLLAGLGIGYLLLCPFILFIFPTAIISSTRLFVHLAAHDHTGREETWWNVFFWYALRIDTNGFKFDTRDNFRKELEQQRQSQMNNDDNTDDTSPTQPLIKYDDA